MADCKRLVNRLPDTYQELTALGNSGTQYIDTGLKGSDLADCELEIVMRNNTTSINDYNFNGTYLSGSTAQFGLVATRDSKCRSSINFGFADAISTTGLSLSEFHTIYATNGLQKVNNTVVGTLNFGTLNDGNFLLFARTDPKQGSGMIICTAMSLKSFTVKRNNQYIRNMIPVRRKSDSQLGLYDLANNVFYTNKGTGSFMAGSDVNNWQHSLRKLTTATDTLTTLPADIYADGNTATVGLVGNMSQTGTPTPSNPIYPTECGDLETTGTHAGQYKVSISSANTTTPVYMGEVQTTRKIKKLVLTGDENWELASTNLFALTISQIGTPITESKSVECTHFIGVPSRSTYSQLYADQICIRSTGTQIWIRSNDISTVADFKTYLQQQYAAGTPVTIWYVLSSATTGIVNEPLRKIGNYVDTVSGITIPTITGKDSFDVLTTLKPSEVELTYTGWHDATVKECAGSTTVKRQTDFVNNISSFDGDISTHPVYMGINRCNVSDDGTINAYYGDSGYVEDGSNGQVMVKIPKFYYKVTPDSTGGLDGVNIRKCTWEISSIPANGFALHPAFYDVNGNEIDYFLYGAFDGVGQRGSTYGTSYNTSTDKLSSVAGSSMLPINNLTRATARTMATNRGVGWYSAGVKQTMAVQMLMAVEYGFNSQIGIGQGVVSASAATYAGQTTGNVTSGTQDNKTTPVNWRGIENFWGNINDWIDGLNLSNRVPYFCNSYTFVDDTSSGYTQISFSLPSSGYITALGYDSNNPWVMLPSESSSTSNPTGPISDYVHSASGWYVALLGGRWSSDSGAGALYWGCNSQSSGAHSDVGARVMFVPSAT